MAKKKFFRQKREKTNLTFDANDRRDFLTGFQKRKAERRLKAKELLDKELREEKIRMKQKQRQRLNELYENQRTVPEVEHLLEPTVTYELPQQVVNITTFDANHISGSLGLSLGLNKSDEQNSGIDSNDGKDSDSDESQDLAQKIIKVQKSLKKQRIETIKSSKAFQTQQKLKHKKDISISKQRKKQLRKEMKQMKNKNINKNNKSNKKKNRRKNRFSKT